MEGRHADSVIYNDVTDETPLCPSMPNNSYFATENNNLISAENCPICFEDSPLHSYPTESICFAANPHNPTPCSSCLYKYFKTAILDYRFVACPMCENEINFSLIKNVMEKNSQLEAFNRYDSRLLEQYLKRTPDAKFCPHPDCPYAAFIPNCKNCPRQSCPRCLTEFCGLCQENWHPGKKCQEAKQQNELPNNIKVCPNCTTCIEKLDDGSCNLISCQICQKKFCWLCGKEASEMHFWSPSGCTYFGYNRWNRKQTNYCQLCILLTAPLIVILVTIFALFAILIGLPILVGYLLTSKLKWQFRIVKYTVIPIVVTILVILGPMIYIVFIIIAVPLLYLFFYLIMPIYLCKKGLCCRCRESQRALEETS